jgi:Fur family transcriptional regulator, stress-responsive regulator
MMLAGNDTEHLRAAGLRVTQPRLAVLAAVRGLPHTDADTITRLARGRLGRLSGQAVYDVLHALTTAGLLRRFQPAGGPARYELRLDSHDHLVCRECGVITDVVRKAGPAPCLDTPIDRFTVEYAEVTFWGRCPDCQLHHRSGGER